MRILGLNPSSKFSKNVARDLLWGCWCKGKRIAGVQFPPLPLIYVASVLKQDGHHVDIIDMQAGEIHLSILKELIQKYDVIFLISATMSYNEDAEILAQLKRTKPSLITIIFGAHPTFSPHAALKRESIDIIVQREAEFTIRDVVNALSEGGEKWKRIAGIGYREGNNAVINPDYPYIKNLDELPIPDRSFLSKDTYYYNPIIKYYPWTTALSSRGCPGSCIFCTSPSYYGPMYRARSPQNVVEEMLYLKDLGFREIFYRDEIFTADKKRVFGICEKIIDKKIDISWICSVKANTATFEMFKIMKEAGCRYVRIGVESGVQELLNNVKKNVQLQQIRDAFAWAHTLKLESHAHLMVGLPGETDQTLNQTFKFVNSIQPSTVTYGMMTPYPGTEIFRQVVAANPTFGDGTQINASSIHTNASFSSTFTSLPPEQLERYVRTGYRKFYARPSYIVSRLLKVNDVHELKRLFLAGTHVLSFIFSGDT